MDLEFEGLDDLSQKLEQIGQDAKSARDEAVLEGAKVMQKATEARTPVLTGNLRAHVEISDIEDGEILVYVDQQGDAYYGYFQEVGTSKMRARPFMGPAFNASKVTMEKAIADKLKQRLSLS